jgi:hypothetical protein
MKGLTRKLSILREERHTAATIGCKLSDAFKNETTAKILDGCQHALRVGLLEVEDHLRSWQRRAKLRSKRIKALRKRAGGGSALIQEHLKLGITCESFLQEYRGMLRQFGDALAWTALRHDSRVIFPLFGTRTHHLNPGVGIAAVTHVIIEAHKTGDFLVLDNDLTRCIGVGDITVLRADPRRVTLPLSLELKSRLHGVALTEGAEVSVNFAGTLFNDSSQAELYSDFVAALGLNSGISSDAPVTPSPQITELTTRAKLLVQMVSESRARLNARQEHWQSLRNVLDRALLTGGAYDSPEKGVAYMAVRIREGDNSEGTMTALLGRMQGEGFPQGQPSLTIGDFIKDDRLSTVAPPIAVWPIPLEQRAALLSGRIFLGCVFSSTLWDDVFKGEGLVIQRRRDEWIVRGGQQDMLLDNLEVLKLRAGVAFGGISPRHVAASIRAIADGDN